MKDKLKFWTNSHKPFFTRMGKRIVIKKLRDLVN